MTARDEERELYAILSFAAAFAGIAGHMALTGTPLREYWWTALVVALAVPLAAALTARTRLGRWVAGAGALAETPFVLLFFAWGGFVIVPSVALLWAAALTSGGRPASGRAPHR